MNSKSFGMGLYIKLHSGFLKGSMGFGFGW